MPPREGYVYRLFGKRRALLYVGHTSDPINRIFFQHQKDKWWFGDVVDIHIEEFESVPAAKIAEHKAIVFERPRYNRTYPFDALTGLVSDDFEEALSAHLKRERKPAIYAEVVAAFKKSRRAVPKR